MPHQQRRSQARIDVYMVPAPHESTIFWLQVRAIDNSVAMFVFRLGCEGWGLGFWGALSKTLTENPKSLKNLRNLKTECHVTGLLAEDF